MPEPKENAEKGPSLLGRKIDKYEVTRFVGRGGMGCVYEALNTGINKRVAIKCIDHALALSADAKARFQREALAASAADSPYIVQIFDAGTTSEGLPYIVMELLLGEDLGSHLAGVGRLDLGDALAVTAQILKGLGHAHAAGVVHRDLKPDNVFLVARDDEPAAVKLLDFGVSKIAKSTEVPLETLTREGTVVGTPYYMSPEQAQSFPDVDGRADIYSCTAILYECLCGRPPHVGQSYEQVIVNICMKDAEDVRAHNPAVPESIAAVLKKGLARAREDRYASARDMLEALLQAAPEDLRSSAGPLSPQRVLTPRGGGLRIQLPANSPAPRRLSDPQELADTVALPQKTLGDSGERPVSRPSSSSTLRSPDVGAKTWRAIAYAGIAALIGVVAFVVVRGGSNTPLPGPPPQAGEGVPTAATSTPTATPISTPTPTSTPSPSASASVRVVSRPPHTPLPIAHTAAELVPSAPAPPPTAAPSGLELLPR